jgi:hypothetical protein
MACDVRMIVKMGDYAWSEHIVTVFLSCQITIKNVQVQLSQRKNNPEQLHPHPEKMHAVYCVISPVRIVSVIII